MKNTKIRKMFICASKLEYFGLAFVEFNMIFVSKPV